MMHHYIFTILMLLTTSSCSETNKQKVINIDVVYKMLTLAEWEHFENTKVFKGSAMDQQDGFIHFSFAHQWSSIREKFFHNISPLVLLSVDVASLDESLLKVEKNRPNGDAYPHYYGVLTMSMVKSKKVLN